MEANTDSLIVLAKDRFGLITTAEQKMLLAIERGQVADFSGVLSNSIDPLSRVTQRTISAEVLRWLLTEQSLLHVIKRQRIVVKFAVVHGELDLSGSNIGYILGLINCTIPNGINLQDTHIVTFNLQGTFCKHLIGDRIKTSGSIYLRFGFRTEGPIILANSSIKGDLDCTGAHFSNPFLSSDNNVLKNKVHPQFFLAQPGTSLALDRSLIEGDVFLRFGFQSHGQVRLMGSTINGSLDCRGGQFFSSVNPALGAELAKIRGWARFDRDEHTKRVFETNGDVSLSGSTVGGFVSFRHAQFKKSSRNGAEIRNAVIGGPLIWKEVNINKTTRLRLSHTKIGQLLDDETSWPRKNRLSLNGLTYDEIRGAPVHAKNRKKWLNSRFSWLHRQPRTEFSLQPYRQLAESLRRTGYEENARAVLIKMYDERRKRGGLSKWGSVGSVILKFTIGYGYKSHLAFLWGLGFVLVGAFIFYKADSNNLMLHPNPNTVVRFNSIAYSLDTFLPVINLHQEDWSPNSTQPVGLLVQIYLWLHTLMGWILTTLGVAGFTGLIRKE